MSLIKLAETIEMSIDIPDNEKKVAIQVVVHFERLVKKMQSFNQHLNKMYDPFKEFETVSSESVLKYRDAIWKYRKQIVHNFKKIKELALLCVRDLSHFESDTHITKLLSAFSDDIGGLEDQVTFLLSVLENWDTSHYRDNVIRSMELVKKEIGELRKLIYERIIDHINTNILAKSWVDEVRDELKISIQESEPLVAELYKEREEQLKQMLSKE